MSKLTSNATHLCLHNELASDFNHLLNPAKKKHVSPQLKKIKCQSMFDKTKAGRLCLFLSFWPGKTNSVQVLDVGFMSSDSRYPGDKDIYPP